jgi:transcriptional regulator with XRE-family HTH domain
LEVGERVRQARLASGLTQAELAQRVGLERSALVRVEGGGRRLDAIELFKLSDALGLPVAHFVTKPPAAVVSRRAALPESPDVAARERYLVDADLETHLNDTRWLVDNGLLVPPAPEPSTHVATAPDARALALDARARLGLAPTDPLGAAADICERFGLYILVVDRDADGASLLDERFGVAVVGGRAEPGRRR